MKKEEAHEDPEDELDDDDDEAPDAEEAEAVTVAAPAEKGEEAVEASLDEILAKRGTDEAKAGEEEEDESMLSLEREERVETLSVKVVPQQPTEFVCKNCFLVKHRSQLADKRRMFCRDCA